MGKFPKDDEKNNEAWNPGVTLVGMYKFVAEERYNEGGNSDNKYSGPAWHARINSVKELGADYNVNRGPTNTGKCVEDCNLRYVSIDILILLSINKRRRYSLSLTPYHPK